MGDDFETYIVNDESSKRSKMTQLCHALKSIFYFKKYSCDGYPHFKSWLRPSR